MPSLQQLLDTPPLPTSYEEGHARLLHLAASRIQNAWRGHFVSQHAAQEDLRQLMNAMGAPLTSMAAFEEASWDGNQIVVVVGPPAPRPQDGAAMIIAQRQLHAVNLCPADALATSSRGRPTLCRQSSRYGVLLAQGGNTPLHAVLESEALLHVNMDRDWARLIAERRIYRLGGDFAVYLPRALDLERRRFIDLSLAFGPNCNSVLFVTRVLRFLLQSWAADPVMGRMRVRARQQAANGHCSVL